MLGHQNQRWGSASPDPELWWVFLLNDLLWVMSRLFTSFQPKSELDKYQLPENDWWSRTVELGGDVHLEHSKSGNDTDKLYF